MQLAAFLIRPGANPPVREANSDALIANENGSPRPALQLAAFLMRPAMNPADHEGSNDTLIANASGGRISDIPLAAFLRQPYDNPALHESSPAAAPPRNRAFDELSIRFIPEPTSWLANVLVVLLWVAALAGAGTFSWFIARDIVGPRPHWSVSPQSFGVR